LTITGLDSIVAAATSLNSLSIPARNLAQLAPRESQLVTLGLIIDNSHEHSSRELISFIRESGSLKKVILDGLLLIDDERSEKATNLIKLVKAACKQEGIELWKENCKVNGQVDLDSW
jgi:hypothetical protein